MEKSGVPRLIVERKNAAKRHESPSVPCSQPEQVNAAKRAAGPGIEKDLAKVDNYFSNPTLVANFATASLNLSGFSIIRK